ncbi:MAG: AraC family transcriptional regulator [Rhizobiaceae bacterium]|nr:AraC family transcriptional regulator [Rhizobiaceae bacterium]
MDSFVNLMYKTRMSKSRKKATVHVSLHFLPDSAARSGLATVLRAGWLDAAASDGINRLECPGDDILYCLSGKGSVEHDGVSFTLGAGQLAWIAGDQPHGHRADAADPWSLMWFRVDGPDVGVYRRRLFGEARMRMAVAQGSELIAWFQRLFDTLRARSADADLRLNAEVAEFLALLARQGDPALRSEMPAGLNRLRTAIVVNPEHKWSATQMEEVAGLGASQLRRLFKKHLNATPRAYLRRERLAMAQRLMLESNLPLSEIAYACGFFDPYHLSRDFRRVIGRSPASWRRLELGSQTAPPNAPG